ncbi:Uncharacterised protein [Klebsiella pneumoniae]|nr:Uncharacterised protein [Klebsiella pneumoniae]
MVPLQLVILTVMAHRMNFCRIGVAALLAVGEHCTLLPAALPQLVADVEKLVRLVVALVVAKQLRLPHRPRGAVEITGNNVPAHAAISEMVEGGKTAGKRVWRLVAQVGGQPEAEVLGDAGHRRHQHQRIVNRQLH